MLLPDLLEDLLGDKDVVLILTIQHTFKFPCNRFLSH